MSLKVSLSFFILTGKYVLFNYCLQHVNKLIIVKILILTIQHFTTSSRKTTLKRAAFRTISRKDEGNKEARYGWAIKITKSDVNFLRSCFLIDESTKINNTWSEENNKNI